MTLKSIGAVAQFLLTIVIARKFGAAPSGDFFYLLTLALVSGRLGRIGMDRTITRFVAAFAVEDKWQQVRQLVYRSSLVTVVPAGVFAAILGVLLLSAENTGDDKWSAVLYLFIVGTFLSTSMMFSQALQGLKLIAQHMFTANICVYLVVGALVLVRPDVNSLLNYLVIAATITVAVSIYSFAKAVNHRTGGEPLESYKPILSSCIPLYAVAIANIFVGQGSLIFLGQFAEQDVVGIFHVVNRMALLVTFPLLAVNAVIAPRFSEMFKTHRVDEIFVLARKAANGLMLLVAPGILLLVFFSDWVLSLFGAEFVEGASALSIMVLAQTIVLFVGPSQMALVMTGNEKLFRNSAIIAATISLICNLTLVPLFGLMGAAVASAITYITLSGLSFRYFLKLKKKMTNQSA